MSTDNRTSEAELLRLIEQKKFTYSAAEVRYLFAFKAVVREKDPYDSTPDAYDTYTGYGHTFQEAYDRAYAQTFAAEQSRGAL